MTLFVVTLRKFPPFVKPEIIKMVWQTGCRFVNFFDGWILSWFDFCPSFPFVNPDVFKLCVIYRWEVIANFIKQHVTDSDKNAKDVLAKAKGLQKDGLYWNVFYFQLLIVWHLLCVSCLRKCFIQIRFHGLHFRLKSNLFAFQLFFIFYGTVTQY